MLITKEVEIKGKSLPVNNLNRGSHHIVIAKCDFCERELKIQWRRYLDSYENLKIFSCNKCAYKKRYIINMKIYGVENIFQLDEIKEKTKKTNIEKYGVEYAAQNIQIKEKIKQTNLEKYGVKYALQNKEIREKIKKTNLERYGSEYTFNSEEVRKKIKETNLERYGVEYIFNSEEVRKKIRETNIEKYGVEYIFNSEEVRKKIRETNIEKYGVEYVSKNNKIKEKIKKSNSLKSEDEKNLIKEKIKKTNIERYGVDNPSKNKNIIQKIKDTKYKKYGSSNPFLVKEYCDKFLHTHIEKMKHYFDNKLIDYDMINKIYSLINDECGHNYLTTQKLYKQRRSNKQIVCTICNPVNSLCSSKEERISKLFINESLKISRNDRNIITPYEIDIFIPIKKIGIEFNGVYWHSDKIKTKYYHFNKRDKMNQIGNELLTIWEDQIENTKIVDWMIESIKEPMLVDVKIDIFSNDDFKYFNLKNIKFNYRITHNNELVGLLSIHKRNDITIIESLINPYIIPINIIDELKSFLNINTLIWLQDNDIEKNYLFENIGLTKYKTILNKKLIKFKGGCFNVFKSGKTKWIYKI